ncbi:MAG: hypothetical protein WAN48_08090 [Actinomycetes bacterium]
MDASRPPSTNENPFAAPPGHSTNWRNVGIVVALILLVMGLAIVGLAVLFVVSVNSWGSNK